MKYFESVDDCNIFAFEKALNGDLKHLRIEGGTEEEDVKAWDKVYNSYIVEIGLGDKYERILNLQSELAEAQLDYVINEDRLLLNTIDSLESDLEAILKDTVKGDLTKSLIMIGKWQGYRIEKKETTVLEFHKTLDLMKEENHG